MSEALTEFLLARITEDEAAARETRWLALEYGVDSAGRDAFSRRVLAECEAKRRIVERVGGQASYLLEPDDDDMEGGWSEAVYLAADVLTALALPYADHPDYRDEWRP